MAESVPKKVKIPPKPQIPQKKKKKNAPDRPQPAWLFPPDEQNPVLSAKPKTSDILLKETQEREKALDYMKRRVHAVPDRPAPPSQLLTLVGIFLTEYGFNSTSRLFTNERRARQALNGWEDAIGQKIEKGTPTLEKIYRDWYHDFKISHKDDTSSSGSEDEENNSSENDADGAITASGQISSDEDADDSEVSSDGLGGSDIEAKTAPKHKTRSKKKSSATSSSESSTSDSDADDEQNHKKIAIPAPKKKSAPATKSPAPKPVSVSAMINKLKRKANSSPSKSSDSEADSPGKVDMPQIKKMKMKATARAKVAPKDAKSATTKATSQSSSESSTDESDDSDAMEPVSSIPVKSANNDPAPSALVVKRNSSDSSVTINGDSKKSSNSPSSASEVSSATSSSSNSEETDGKLGMKQSAPVGKTKHEGARPTQLAALSATATDESHISNKYQSYDYADKAYKDLSVTRGKGFTKEKNKKKRGSYRGGAIDTAGGKSHKFED